jgi:hypothetical protein
MINVAMALVLLVDVSGSVDAREYAIQKDGIVAALHDRAVHQAIWNQRGICLAYVEWSDQAKTVVDWRHVVDVADAQAFAEEIAKARRASMGSTHMGNAIMHAVAMFATSPCSADRRVIDVSGDGPSNGGSPLPDAIAAARAADITINALPILGADEPGLEAWYAASVVSDGFLLVAESFEDFRRAMRQKMALEIADLRP